MDGSRAILSRTLSIYPHVLDFLHLVGQGSTGPGDLACQSSRHWPDQDGLCTHRLLQHQIPIISTLQCLLLTWIGSSQALGTGIDVGCGLGHKRSIGIRTQTRKSNISQV